jgi:DNA-binding MarR family transcriptional regulator
MPDSLFGSRAADAETEITLGLLTAIERDSSVTQRSAAKQLGIALGLANAYLKRCIKKGLIKVKQAPPNRYAYYLTPKGFAEKSRLTARYLSISLDFFRHARTQCTEVLEACAARGWTRIALIGVSDLGEIATLCARDVPVSLVGFVDPNYNEPAYLGLPVFRAFADATPVDAAMITSMNEPQEAYEATAAVFPATHILAPRFLNITPKAKA